MEIKKGKLIIVGDKLHIYKSDLLRALSWFDFLHDTEMCQEDQQSKDNILKIINYITRNG